MRVKGVSSSAMSQLKAATIFAQSSMTSSLLIGLLHLAIIELILGGYISFILLAMRRTVMAICSQFSQVTQMALAPNLVRQAIARYCVSLVTFLLQERIHLMANFLYQSSVDSMELEEELVVSVKLGNEVAFWRILAEVVWMLWDIFICIFFLCVPNIIQKIIAEGFAQLISEGFRKNIELPRMLENDPFDFGQGDIWKKYGI